MSATESLEKHNYTDQGGKWYLDALILERVCGHQGIEGIKRTDLARK